MTRPALSGSTFRDIGKTFLSSYGMAVVLLLLCVYYSWATLQVRQPEGDAAAQLVASQIGGTLPKSDAVMVVGSASDSDRLFAAGAARRLKNSGYTVVGPVLGDPGIVRRALVDAEKTGVRLGAVATTSACASWTVLQDIPKKYPRFSATRLYYGKSYRWPLFLQSENLLNIANQTVVVAVIAVGMTLVIITGGIDLSVGSLVALAAVVSTSLIRSHGGAGATDASMVSAGAAAVLLCAGIGLFSGVTITAFRLPPFIATLGVMQIASGIAFILSKGASIYSVPDAFTQLGRGTGFLGIPYAVMMMAVIYLAAHFLMTRAKLGRYIYAVGGNPEAARLSGVRVTPIILLVYTLSGAMAGLGGLVLASQLKSGAPTYGVSYELYVIAAVVVGGASLSGGQGKIFGTLIGAFIIAVIQNGMNLTGVQSYTQRVVLGVVILAAVLLDMLKHRDWRWLRPRSDRKTAIVPPAFPEPDAIGKQKETIS
ncbi:MAG: ABC transporter permease [Capsulimonas sp.]|uniref:ABC transporter permease n=1 Tax=Capsulimonas sp. TaxID=2494211 RepID=UPI003265EC05